MWCVSTCSINGGWTALDDTSLTTSVSDARELAGHAVASSHAEAGALRGQRLRIGDGWFYLPRYDHGVSESVGLPLMRIMAYRAVLPCLLRIRSVVGLLLHPRGRRKQGTRWIRRMCHYAPHGGRAASTWLKARITVIIGRNALPPRHQCVGEGMREFPRP